jgi:hypothetical protein
LEFVVSREIDPKTNKRAQLSDLSKTYQVVEKRIQAELKANTTEF